MAESRYAAMTYRRCGRSGLKLPPISLGLWHNFGTHADNENCRRMLWTAFDAGITHFDIANNYGPLPGSAETRYGDFLRTDFAGHRDELIISTKAGYHMWEGPYGEWGSRKYLLSSLDQSLKRLGLPYVDIFYSHRFDPETPLEETMGALDTAVRQGKALYAGISNYNAANTRKAAEILRGLGTPCLIHQPVFSLFNRGIESDGLLGTLVEEGIGSIAFSPLAQGMLTDRYLDGVPPDSRAAQPGFFPKRYLTDDVKQRVRGLDAIAKARGQKLSQMALAWVLKKGVTTALIGASKPEQITECLGAVRNIEFTDAEMKAIDGFAAKPGETL
jgi:L-glyceraldehyde 3-phosphate reductase